MLGAIILMIVFKFDIIATDCGSPPLPVSTNVIAMDNNTDFADRYQEYSVVRYECDSNIQELVGNSSLRCFNGRWIGRPPKCANPTISRVKKLTITDESNGKKITARAFGNSFGISFGECYNPGHKWNITSKQRLLFEIETYSQIDYFSLIVFGNDLINEWSNKHLVITAKMERPRKKCKIEKFEVMAHHSNKTQISFKCFKVFDELHHNFNPKIKDFIQMISLSIESKDRISVKYCLLTTFSFSDSCGSPERPLHSIEVLKEKTFVEYSCEEDFYLEPIDGHKLVCGSFGDWNQPFPRCLTRTKCHLPAMDVFDHNIHVDYKNLNYLNGTPYAETNSIAIYSCRSTNITDVQLIGDNQRVCSKGFWSGSQPKCLEKMIRKQSIKIKESEENLDPKNMTNSKSIGNNSNSNDTKWHRLHLLIILVLVSFLIGSAFVGFIVFLLMKYLSALRSRRRSCAENIPSVVVSEPNHYYERNAYEEYRYESLRLNAFELLDLERINSLYQTTN